MDTDFLQFKREFATDFIAILKENILTFASCENCISDKNIGPILVQNHITAAE